MRPIKFRVWCPTSKHFSTQPWLSCDGVMLKWEHTGDQQTLTDIRFDNYVIQQYTGLKDKNDKEIYEGDIVHYLFDGASYPKEAQDKYLTCVYDSDFGGFCFDDADSSYYWAEVRGYVEVVGNIFENPELLDKTKEL